MPTFDMTSHNFLDNPAMDAFTFGRPPVAIDIITKRKGLAFEDAYATAIVREVEDVTVRLIQYQQLLEAKKAAGRPRDQNDIENLDRARSSL